MTDSANDVLGLDAVEPYERYRNFEIDGLAVRVTIPDGVQETGRQGVSKVVSVYELVGEERGRFIATVYRLDGDLPALAHFNVHFERVLDRERRSAVIDLVEAWWRRRRDWKDTRPAQRRTATPRQGR
ncbi:hypothetical protein [Glycomyces tenuis]|uniref:hypothetical protein n=1 Tax=Glycomyces tenuis TaxID=58116 RepID=UPI00040F01E7|nr:hypothetical protein [Glycomyces tenuis]